VYTSPFLDTDDLKMALRARKLSGAFEKRAPGLSAETGLEAVDKFIFLLKALSCTRYLCGCLERHRGVSFQKKLWRCVGGKYNEIMGFLSTGLIMWISHRKEIRKLTLLERQSFWYHCPKQGGAWVVTWATKLEPRFFEHETVEMKLSFLCF